MKLFGFFKNEKNFWEEIIESYKFKSGLALGSGAKTYSKWTNLDIQEKKGVDIVHNLLHIPWPSEDNKFDIVVCEDILEHIPNRTSFVADEVPNNYYFS